MISFHLLTIVIENNLVVIASYCGLALKYKNEPTFISKPEFCCWLAFDPSYLKK